MARITSLADLANNITGAVESISSLVTGKTGIPKYPRDPAIAPILSNSELQGNWMKLSFPYTFSVMDINTKPLNSPKSSRSPSDPRKGVPLLHILGIGIRR